MAAFLEKDTINIDLKKCDNLKICILTQLT